MRYVFDMLISEKILHLNIQGVDFQNFESTLKSQLDVIPQTIKYEGKIGSIPIAAQIKNGTYHSKMNNYSRL